VDSTTSYDLAKKILDLKTYLHSKNKELDSSVVYSKMLLKNALKNDDTSLVGKTYFKLGGYYKKENQFDSAYYYYNESKGMFSILKDSVQVGRRYLNMAIILSDRGVYSLSDEVAIEGLKFLENSDDNKTIASLENCLAISARKREVFQEALMRYEKAIEKTNSGLNRLKYLNNKAYLYIKTQDYKEAIKILESILNLMPYEIEEDDLFCIKVQDNLAYAEWLSSGDNIYEKDLLQALEKRIKANSLLGKITSYDHLSHFYTSFDVSKSKEYALKMYSLATQINGVDDRMKALKKLMDLDEDNSDYSKYSKRFVKLMDSAKVAQYKTANKFAKIHYESEKRKVLISELRATNAERQLHLERAKIQTTLAVILMVSLILVGYVLYKNIIIRHKKDKMTQVYQTETNISKRIHDEIANDVYNAMTKLQGAGAVNKEAVIDDLDYVYKRARDISKEHGSIDVEDNFEDVLNDLFLNFESDDVRIITRGMNKIDWNSIDELKRTTIYRVLQELLVNMKKHSKANIISISFKTLKKKLDIQYSDNGVGCDIKKKGGLLNVENRILSFGGTVTFDSEKDKGFNVSIEI